MANITVRRLTRTLQPTCYPYDCSTANENGTLFDCSTPQGEARTRLNSALYDKTLSHMNVQAIIRELTEESDIALQSDVYEEVFHELVGNGLNLACFVFETSEHSSCSRSLQDSSVTCPVLTLYLKYESDFRLTGIDPHSGNWGDTWAHTKAVRDALNTVLHRRAFGETYVSEYTFIFVRTLEDVVFRQIGQECSTAVRDLVCSEAPGVQIDGIYWQGAKYYVLMRNKADYKRVKRQVKERITKALPKLLSRADKDKCCQEYKAKLEFGYGGVVPMEFVRG